MKCPRCQHENPSGMRFCGQCAAALSSVCPSCGAGNPPENKFCGQCATPRGRLLVAALGFAGLPRPSYDRSLWALRTWLDSWSGIGRIAIGMERQGFDLQLTRYDEKGWRAAFYTTGMEHSITSATASAWERTPWHATQRAA